MSYSPEDQGPGPTDIRDPIVVREAKKAAVWIGMALLAAGVVVLAAPLLVIVGAMVLAVILDGGARLLGRVLPISRSFRLLIVILAGLAFVGWTAWYSGVMLAGQFVILQDVVIAQLDRLAAWATAHDAVPDFSMEEIGGRLFDSVGRVTSVLSSALGAIAGGLLILVIGIFIAAEPRLYDRGVAWMLPSTHRHTFYEVSDKVAYTLRRLLFGRIVGMLVEGIFTYVMLTLVASIIGVGAIPLAAVLALLTGLLAFIPNVGAVVSGILMVAVGFSVSTEAGLYCVFVYFFVQNFDGYVVIPYIARKTVDLAPALVLAAQLIFGTLFGFLGLLLADPIIAAIKATLEEISKVKEEGAPEAPPASE